MAVDGSAGSRPPAFKGPWHYLFWLMARQRGRVVRAAMFGSLWMVGLTVPPYALRMAIDHGLQAGRTGPLILWAAVLVVVAGVTAWLAIMRHRTMTWVRMDAAFRTIRLVSDQAMRLGHTLGRQGLTGETPVSSARLKLFQREPAAVVGVVLAIWLGLGRRL